MCEYCIIFCLFFNDRVLLYFYLVFNLRAAAAAKSLQSCPTLRNPIDGSPPGSPVPGILQARTLEWVAISFSTAGKWKVKVKLLSCLLLFATPWTAAYPAPPSMGFSRQEYWSGLPFPSLGDLPDPGIEPRSPALQPDALRTLEWVAISSSRESSQLRGQAQVSYVSCIGRWILYHWCHLEAAIFFRIIIVFYEHSVYNSF